MKEQAKAGEKPAAQAGKMQSYYRWHAKIYDATRWTFLLGRSSILRKLPAPRPGNTLLEVGCGTGRNLRELGLLYPELYLIGVDVSSDMLNRAGKATQDISRRLLLFEKPYAPGAFSLDKPVDYVLFSYALTMFNPGWEDAIQRAWDDLVPGGHIAVVDFHRTPSATFAWWMAQNHVRMDGQLLPLLRSTFKEEYCAVKSAYLGLWQYVMFIGRKG